MSKTLSSAKRPAIYGLSHMAFYAHDLDKTLAYYRGMLGWEEQSRLPRGEGAFVNVNEYQYVELRPERQANTDRMISFGFVVDDAAGLSAYLRERGVVTEARPPMRASQKAVLAAWDPDGHMLEFVQPFVRPAGTDAPTGDRIDLGRVSARMMHIGFTVFCLDKSMAFYRDTLGFTELWRGSRDDRQLSWVQLKLPDGLDYIEFMLYDGPPTLEQYGIWNHFGLEVPGVPAAVEAVAKRPAISVYQRPIDPKIGKCHHRLANIFDPDGTRAEFMERATFDGQPTPPATAAPPR